MLKNIDNKIVDNYKLEKWGFDILNHDELLSAKRAWRILKNNIIIIEWGWKIMW